MNFMRKVLGSTGGPPGQGGRPGESAAGGGYQPQQELLGTVL